MSTGYVTSTEIGHVADNFGLPIEVSYGTFPEGDGGGIEGLLRVGTTTAVFDPSEDDSLAQLRFLIGHLQELERVGTMSR